VKNYNCSRLPWEESAAPLGATAHSLGTTGVDHCFCISVSTLNVPSAVVAAQTRFCPCLQTEDIVVMQF